MRTREALTWALYGGIAIVAFSPGHTVPAPPTKPPKGSGGPPKGAPPKAPPSGGGKQGDVISYYVDVPGTGLIVVKTPESPDTRWGAPDLQPEKVPAFQSMMKTWGQLVDDTGIEFRVPSKEIFAFMWSESKGNPNAESKLHAMGLMQVMPFHFPSGTSREQMLDPRTNVRRGVALLAQARASGTRDLIQTASIYNAGPPAGPARTSSQNRWGYVAEPGYIDSVVAAYNTAVKLGVS